MALTSLGMTRAFVGLSAESRNLTTTIASRQIDFTNYTCPLRKLQSTQQSTRQLPPHGRSTLSPNGREQQRRR
jgi:hypothetical protein